MLSFALEPMSNKRSSSAVIDLNSPITVYVNVGQDKQGEYLEYYRFGMFKNGKIRKKDGKYSPEEWDALISYVKVINCPTNVINMFSEKSLYNASGIILEPMPQDDPLLPTMADSKEPIVDLKKNPNKIVYVKLDKDEQGAYVQYWHAGMADEPAKIRKEDGKYSPEEWDALTSYVKRIQNHESNFQKINSSKNVGKIFVLRNPLNALWKAWRLSTEWEENFIHEHRKKYPETINLKVESSDGQDLIKCHSFHPWDHKELTISRGLLNIEHKQWDKLVRCIQNKSLSELTFEEKKPLFEYLEVNRYVPQKFSEQVPSNWVPTGVGVLGYVGGGVISAAGMMSGLVAVGVSFGMALVPAVVMSQTIEKVRRDYQANYGEQEGGYLKGVMLTLDSFEKFQPEYTDKLESKNATLQWYTKEALSYAHQYMTHMEINRHGENYLSYQRAGLFNNIITTRSPNFCLKVLDNIQSNEETQTFLFKKITESYARKWVQSAESRALCEALATAENNQKKMSALKTFLSSDNVQRKSNNHRFHMLSVVEASCTLVCLEQPKKIDFFNTGLSKSKLLTADISTTLTAKQWDKVVATINRDYKPSMMASEASKKLKKRLETSLDKKKEIRDFIQNSSVKNTSTLFGIIQKGMIEAMKGLVDDLDSLTAQQLGKVVATIKCDYKPSIMASQASKKLKSELETSLEPKEKIKDFLTNPLVKKTSTLRRMIENAIQKEKVEASYNQYRLSCRN